MRVLVVEDEKKLGELVARGLREEGYAADPRGHCDAEYAPHGGRHDVLFNLRQDRGARQRERAPVRALERY